MEPKMAQGMIANDMGFAAMKEGNLNQAVALFRQSIETCKEISDWQGEIVALNNLAEALLRKWARERIPGSEIMAETESSLLADGLECLARDIELCVMHKYLEGAGQTVNDLPGRLMRHAGLSEWDAINVSNRFMKERVVPLLKRHDVRELPGPLGFPALRRTDE